MPTIELVLPKPHPGQARVKSGLRRFNVLNMGRRWGKSTFAVDYIAKDPLSGYPIGWFSPTYKLMIESWRDVLRVFAPMVERKNATERRIELMGGGVVEFWPVEGEDVARSRHYKKVVIDEAAMIPHLQDAWEQGIRPTLTDLKGEALFASTPKGLNYFHKLHTRGLDEQYPDWAAWTEPTSNNPYIADEEIEAARQELPELVFQQEYLAEFAASAGQVFRRIDESLYKGGDTPEDHAGHMIIMANDWGKQKDFTTISVGCATCKRELAIDRFNQIDYAFQRGRLKTLYDKWGARGVLPERNSIGSPNIEQLQREGFSLLRGPDGEAGFNTTATTKPQLIENLSLVFEKQEWQFLDDPLWKSELQSYTRTVSPVTGRSSYSAPDGMHDDTVIARALMVWAARGATKLNEQPEQRSRFDLDGIGVERDWKRF